MLYVFACQASDCQSAACTRIPVVGQERVCTAHAEAFWAGVLVLAKIQRAADQETETSRPSIPPGLRFSPHSRRREGLVTLRSGMLPEVAEAAVGLLTETGGVMPSVRFWTALRLYDRKQQTRIWPLLQARGIEWYGSRRGPGQFIRLRAA